MKHKVVILALLAGLLGGVLASALPTSKTKGPEHKETSFERVMRTKTIRCGYIEWPGYVEKDPSTGKMSGVAYEIAEAIGKELELKVEWTEPTGWGSYQEGLNAGRYDVACGGLWLSGNRIRQSLLTQALFYSGMYATVRADDNRFDADLTAINNPGVRAEVIEADVTNSIKDMLFPKAQTVTVSPMVDSGQYALNVILNKADVAFVSPEIFNKYNASNEKKLKLAAQGKPVRVFGNSFAMKTGELELKAMLDGAAQALGNSGTLEQIAHKYAPNTLAVARGYQE